MSFPFGEIAGDEISVLDYGAVDAIWDEQNAMLCVKQPPGFLAARVASWQREDYYYGLSSPPILLATSTNRFTPGDTPTWWPIPQQLFPIGQQDPIVLPYKAAQTAICRAIETLLPEVDTILLIKLGTTSESARTVLWLSAPPNTITETKAGCAIPRFRRVLSEYDVDRLLVLEIVEGVTSKQSVLLEDEDLEILPTDLCAELEALQCQPGVQIVPAHRPNIAGSGGLCIVAGPPGQRKVYMLTCGHVVAGGDVGTNKLFGQTLALAIRTENAERLAIVAVTKTELQKPAERAEENREVWERAVQGIEIRLASLEQRRLGRVAWKPPVVYPPEDYPHDLALVELDREAWSGCTVNTIAWSGGPAAFNHRSAAKADSCMKITSPVTASDYVPRGDICLSQHLVKRGGSTGVTFGAVSAVDALWQARSGSWAQFVLAISLPTECPFGQRGDSGSSAFDEHDRWFGTITAGYRGPMRLNKSDISFLVPAWHIMAQLKREGFQDPQVVKGGKLSL